MPRRRATLRGPPRTAQRPREIPGDGGTKPARDREYFGSGRGRPMREMGEVVVLKGRRGPRRLRFRDGRNRPVARIEFDIIESGALAL